MLKKTIYGVVLLVGLFLASCNPDGGGYAAKSNGNNSSVGSNAGKNDVPLDEQCCTPFTQDLCGSATPYDGAAIIALLVSQGANHITEDGTLTPFAATDVIHQIDVNLKPVEGEGQCWDGTAFVTNVASECDAIYGSNNGQSNLDPGGSRENDGDSKGPEVGGYSLPSQFDFVEVKPDAIVSVSGTICQNPALLNQVKGK